MEDTDAERNSYSQLPEFLEMLRWLGLDHYSLTYQSHNKPRHIAIVQKLEAEGNAYRCYITKEELESQRTAQGYVTSPWRDGGAAPTDKEYVVRFKMPHNQQCAVEDAVRGTVSVDTSTLDDMVLLRSDGTPTYVLACVVDDYDAEVTHIIRGDEHLTNAFRQSMICQALGWVTPKFAHIPLVCDTAGNKLSKRVNSQNIAHLRSDGYLPEAILNAILRTGWSCGNNEIIPVASALKMFDLDGINKAAARLDPKKLIHLNGYYIRSMPAQDLWEQHIKPRLLDWSSQDKQRALALLEETAKRHSTVGEIVDALKYCQQSFVIEVSELDPAPMKKIHDVLQNCADFSKATLEPALREFASINNLHFGRQVASPLRIAVTGSNTSPCLFHVLSSLGKELVLARIKLQC